MHLARSFLATLLSLVALQAWSDPLTKVTVTSELVEKGRAMVFADRGNFLMVDSVPPLGGPNVALNPTELMVGSLATCATFVAKVSLESMKMPFDTVKATVEGDFNPKSVKSGQGDPSFKEFRITYEAQGLNAGAKDTIKANLPKRCPIFATLTKSATINVGFAKGEAGKPGKDLATVSVSSQIYKDGTRSFIHSRNHFLVVDSVPPLGGKNETLNPIDLTLAAQSTCVLFVAETNMKKMGVPMTATVTGAFDPRGVKGENVDPRIQKMEINLKMPEMNASMKDSIIADVKKRCPIFTTLNKSAEITFQ